MSAILYIEDHDDTRQAVSRLLLRWGHLVTTAATMRAGLTLAQSKNFDVLISDIGLPDGDGYELIREIRKRCPAVPAVALTACCTDDDRRDAMEAGFNEHLSKPVDTARLRSFLSTFAQE